MISCTKFVIDELQLSDSEALALAVGMQKTGRIAADPSIENVMLVRNVWDRIKRQQWKEDDVAVARDGERTGVAEAAPTKNRMLILGHPVSCLVRWLGSVGVELQRVREIVDRFGGSEVKTSGLRTFWNEGRRGVGKMAKPTDGEQKKILTA